MSNILPILTASLGTVFESRLDSLIELVGVELFRANVIDQIISALNLNEKPAEKPMKIYYSVEEKDRRIEQ